MNVALLNDSFPPVIDGVANVVMNYAKIMEEENIANVMVATPKYPDTDYSIYPYKVVPYSSFDTTKIVKGYRAGNPLDFKELREMTLFKPDIIHTHCPVASTYLARMLRATTNVPVVFTYHTKFDEDIARAVKADFLQKESIRVIVNNIEACDEVWVVSQGAGENLKSLGYEGEYRVVSNGVDFEKGRVSIEGVKSATKDYDLPEDIPVFLFVGRIISYKGIPIIMDALGKMHSKGIDFRMVFVGSGPDMEEMKKKAKELGLYENDASDKVIFTGPIYDRNILRAWNTRADLFLFPSTYDTNGIVVREAAACGLASVLIKGSCAAEGITNNVNGFMIEQNSESLYELLTNLINDMDHIHQVGQNAMDQIYISWKDSVHAAWQRYGEIIENKAAIKSRRKLSEPIKGYFAGMTEDILAGFDFAEDEIQKVFHKSNITFDNMLDNVDDFREDIKLEIFEKLHGIKGIHPIKELKNYTQSINEKILRGYDEEE